MGKRDCSFVRMDRRKLERLHKLPTACWSWEEAKAMDEFIRRAVMRNFRRHLRRTVMPKILTDFVLEMVKHHFHTEEVQQLMRKTKCHEKWMEHNERKVGHDRPE
jgi:hypothetical protein